MSDDVCRCGSLLHGDGECNLAGHRTACTLMLAHLKSYASAARSGLPVDGILYLLEYNLKAIRDWTPETIAKAVAELGMTPPPNNDEERA